MIYIFPRINTRYIKKFLLIVGSISATYLVLALTITLSLLAANPKNPSDLQPDSTFNPIVSATDEPRANEADLPAPTATPDNDEGFLKPPARTNFLLIAMDQERILTDALMVGCFYRDTCEVKLMSVPRDMYTIIPEERLTRMRADNLKPPANGIMKINALRSYGGGRSTGNKYLVEQLEEMLGIQLPYYVEVDIPAFKKIVDILGGVTMEIPEGGLYYDDPEQDLHIAVPGGTQFLDGEMAEGVVRFRRYPTGDVGRNAMQLEFMKQLFTQVLKRETIMRDPAAVIDIMLNDVRTNIGADMLKYIPYVTQFSSDKLTTYAMPGEGEYVGDTSYFMPDRQNLAATINEVFYKITE